MLKWHPSVFFEEMSATNFYQIIVIDYESVI